MRTPALPPLGVQAWSPGSPSPERCAVATPGDTDVPQTRGFVAGSGFTRGAGRSPAGDCGTYATSCPWGPGGGGCSLNSAAGSPMRTGPEPRHRGAPCPVFPVFPFRRDVLRAGGRGTGDPRAAPRGASPAPRLPAAQEPPAPTSAPSCAQPHSRVPAGTQWGMGGHVRFATGGGGRGRGPNGEGLVPESGGGQRRPVPGGSQGRGGGGGEGGTEGTGKASGGQAGV